MKRLGFWQAVKAMFFGWNKTVLPPTPVDLVVAIANGRATLPMISSAAIAITDVACRFVQEGYAGVLGVTGGNRFKSYFPDNPDEWMPTEAQTVVEYLDKKGFTGKVVVEKTSVNTWENIDHILDAFSVEFGYRPRQIIVVNHPDHLGRTIVVAQFQGVEVWPVAVKILWSDTDVPVFMRSRWAFRVRNALASLHHLVFHLVHCALKTVGIRFSHPWM